MSFLKFSGANFAIKVKLAIVSLPDSNSVVKGFVSGALEILLPESIQTWLQQSGSYYHFFKKPRDFEALIDLKNVVNFRHVVNTY
jgi:hypothetical protein